MWLREPYINCVECNNTFICTQCFASGGERAHHQNYHNYSVIRNEFPLFGNWTAKEELTLLEAMIECGAGNWTDAAKKLESRSEEDCIKHYFNYYIENSDLQLQADETFSQHKVEGPHQALLTPYNRFVTNFRKSHDLEGPEDHGHVSANDDSHKIKLNPYLKQYQQQSQRKDHSRPYFECRATQFIPGYNAARGEFTIEFDDHAEVMVAELDSEIVESEDDDYELLTDMQVAIVKAYNERLKERKRRKQIIRRHGLLLLQKTIGWLQRYEVSKSCFTISEAIFVLYFEKYCFLFDLILEN